ncbi:DUF72 domain-containing protein [Variovorax sp. dw_954]|uniref:DUF72 domain-containing protein n=1 Tax=Variovorax sp. dw_954 TaxID=2720078 RepID=UPI001BD30DC9|nr:DUF72 domain-containing protein [Variovorax sp. dw_954]
MAASKHPVRVGIGGWTFEPWRDNFYPKGLSQKLELQYASRHLTAIEVNGTYYSTMKPESFRKWHDETPDDFVFSLKASRFATNRKVLADAGDSIARFVGSGIVELGDKLGPIVWQFMPTKQFDAEDFEAFLSLLPKKEGSRALRHVMDVRHESFISPDYQKLAKKYKVSTVFTDSDKFPSFDEPEGDFAYSRLMMCAADLPTGYAPEALDAWATRAKGWTTLPVKRDVFVFMINGAKERAPAAAAALLERLGWAPS